MRIGYIGLGKMGRSMVLRLKEKGHEVVAWNRGEEGRRAIEKEGIETRETLTDLVAALPTPCTIWLMVTHTGVDALLADLLPYLSRGDTIIDGGNCFYKDTVRRGRELEKKGVDFLDAGVSGGPKGAREGACIMVGGKATVFNRYRKLFRDLAAPNAFAHLGQTGAGHFVKMVHNGIEYGMMQSIAEGFEVLQASEFKIDLQQVAELYNHRSVIESRLVGWLASGFKKDGERLSDVSNTVAATGEGAWTVATARELGVPVSAIEAALEFRENSAKESRFAGKILSVLRHEFGGHDYKEKKSQN